MNKYTIADVLPHKNPMILIDEIGEYDDETCVAQVTITPKSPFYDSNKQGVPSYIGCEYMAQAIAGFAGAQALDIKKPVQIGFLLGSRKYKTFRPYFHLNETLTITLKELYREDSGLRVFDCEIVDQEKVVIAQANINVYQPNDPESFILESYQ